MNFSTAAIEEIRAALKDEAAGNSRATMTDLDLACDILDNYAKLSETIREYLKYGSTDGKLERRPLREKLNQLISK